MKDSKEYSRKIQKLYRSLREAAKPVKVEYEEPVDALVYAVVSENLTDAQTQAAIRKMRDHFVDWNDLRVALVDEIVDALGDPAAREMALRLTNILRAVFEKYNMLTLQPLRKLGKRPAKLVLEKLNGATPFIVDYCMLTGLDGHAMPLTPAMIKYMKEAGLAHPDASYEEIEGFLARQIPAKNTYESYALLRHETESGKARPARKTRSAAKT